MEIYPLFWRCALWSILWQIQFKAHLDRCFSDAGSIKKKSLGSPQKQQGSQTTVRSGDRAFPLSWGSSYAPKPSSLPPREGKWGKEINQCKRAAGVWRKKGQRTWDYFCSKTNWLDKWNIMESANSAPLSIRLSSGHFICPSSSQQNKMKCIFYCKLLYSTGCKRLEDFPRGEWANRWLLHPLIPKARDFHFQFPFIQGFSLCSGCSSTLFIEWQVCAGRWQTDIMCVVRTRKKHLKACSANWTILMSFWIV